jgi:hypothetical protein
MALWIGVPLRSPIPAAYQALNVARQQHALFWELRCAMSLARLRMKQDRKEDARQLLGAGIRAVHRRLLSSVAVPSASDTRLAVRSSLVAKLTRTWQLSRIELLAPYAFSI